MSIQTAADWEGLRRVARVVRLTLDALEGSVAAGVSRMLDAAGFLPSLATLGAHTTYGTDFPSE